MGERAERNAQVVRGIYGSIAQGDMPAVLAALSADVVWHTPEGHGRLSGDRKGHDEVLGLFGLMFELSEGTLRAEILDVVASDDHAAARVHATARARGKVLDDRPVHLYRFGEDGLVVEVAQYPFNRDGRNAFWE
jgi:ketosteroid isomerase-like protein